MTRQLVPVILAGGSGTRLWPISRTSRPKQFLDLTGDLSLFQQTLLRVNNAELYAPPIVVTNHEYRFLVAEQALEVGIELAAILLEPVARNTAPAIAVAAFAAIQERTDQLLHVLASDHALEAGPEYWQCIERATKAAETGRLVTFGVKPTGPATGYGYIEAGDALGDGVLKIGRFVEKPKLADAKKMLASGNFYWNSGMFLMSAEALIGACRTHCPDVAEGAERAVAEAVSDLDFTRLDLRAFEGMPAISIDYAVFEKTQMGAVVPSAIVWSDLGTWDSVWAAGNKDSSGNAVRGPVTLIGTKASLVRSARAHVVVQGLEGVAVVASEDAVYVGRLDESQAVGEVVKLLKENAETVGLTENNLTTYRPWGGYSSVLNGERFQVKRLFVKPGKSLSLQKHNHRSEHWVVVRGTAEVQVGDEIKMMGENESVYIPRGSVHRLKNPGKMLLELIEVQTGSYLGEDDIIRLADDFGRE